MSDKQKNATPVGETEEKQGKAGRKKTGITARRSLTRITVTGAMVALSIVFCRLLSLNYTDIVRLEIGFLPIVVLAVLYGPLLSGAAYGAADLIGAALTTGINPLITLEKVLTGLVFGLFYRKREKIGIVPIFVSLAIVSVLLDWLMMSWIFTVWFPYTFRDAIIVRGINAAVNFALRVAILIVCDKTRLIAKLKKAGERYA